MLYLDTSVIVAALTSEPRTGEIQGWLHSQDPEGIAISDWVATEFSSALSRKLRTGRIDAGHRAEALAVFARLTAESFAVLPVSRSDFRIAARFPDRHALALRAGEALHLAVSLEHGATLCTLDRRLAEAGVALGVSATLL